MLSGSLPTLVGYLFHAQFAHQTCGINGDGYAEYVQENIMVFWVPKRLCGLSAVQTIEGSACLIVGKRKGRL